MVLASSSSSLVGADALSLDAIVQAAMSAGPRHLQRTGRRGRLLLAKSSRLLLETANTHPAMKAMLVDMAQSGELAPQPCEPMLMSCRDPQDAAVKDSSSSSSSLGNKAAAAAAPGQPGQGQGQPEQCAAPSKAAEAAVAACPAAAGNSRIGNGHCDPELNVAAAPCAWDGGDCCKATCKKNYVFWDTCSSAGMECRDPAAACAGA
jgi:hypothetical protein